MSLENLSEEAQWFLRNVQKLQDDFAESVGAQIVMTDRNGDLITKMSGAQRVCQLIQSKEKGKKECEICYHSALSLIKTQKKALFIDCWAGYASLWVPIKVKDQIVGSITGCGGRYEKGQTEEELREKYSKLADDLNIEDKDDFVKAAVNEVKVITEEEMKKRAERLAKLVGILAEETALREVFGVTE